MIMLGGGTMIGRAAADDEISFYRMLLSEERSVLEAVRGRSVKDLLKIHNEAMRLAGGDDVQNYKAAAGCFNAYIHLSIAALGYVAAIEPERSQPIKSTEENAAWGDRIWAEYLGYLANCEKALGVVSPPDKISRPSEFLR